MQSKIIVLFDGKPSGYILELPDGFLIDMDKALNDYCRWCDLDRKRISGMWAAGVDSLQFLGKENDDYKKNHCRMD